MFPVVEPLAAPQAPGEAQTAQSPGEGIGGKDDRDIGDETNHQCNIDDAQHAPAAEQDQHGGEGLAGTAEYSGSGVSESEQEKEQGLGAGLSDAVGDHAGGGAEQTHKLRRENPETDANP